MVLLHHVSQFKSSSYGDLKPTNHRATVHNRNNPTALLSYADLLPTFMCHCYPLTWLDSSSPKKNSSCWEKKKFWHFLERTLSILKTCIPLLRLSLLTPNEKTTECVEKFGWIAKVLSAHYPSSPSEGIVFNLRTSSVKYNYKSQSDEIISSATYQWFNWY